MNTQSSYVYDDHLAEEGLGSIALRPVAPNRFMPAVKEPVRNIRQSFLPIHPKSRVGRGSRPKPVLKPTPIIDHNPVPPPRPGIISLREAAQKKTPAKTTKGKPLEAARKKANAKAAQKNRGGKGILDGRVSIGGYQIKKTRVAVAGGATAGGLLLLKLLL